MIAIGCDHGGYELKKEIEAYLDSRGLEYRDYGCDSTDSVDYPIYARKVAHAIVDGECEKGILICGTGIVRGKCRISVKQMFSAIQRKEIDKFLSMLYDLAIKEYGIMA